LVAVELVVPMTVCQLPAVLVFSLLPLQAGTLSLLLSELVVLTRIIPAGETLARTYLAAVRGLAVTVLE